MRVSQEKVYEMNEWSQQMEEAGERMRWAWADAQGQMRDAQQQMWSSLAEHAESWSGSEMQAAWKQMVANWQEMTDTMLDTRKDGVHAWAAVMRSPNAPEGMAGWADQVEELTNQWVVFQRQSWGNLFKTIGNVEPASALDAVGSNARTLITQWQTMAQSAIQTQQAWMKAWTQPSTPGE